METTPTAAPPHPPRAPQLQPVQPSGYAVWHHVRSTRGLAIALSILVPASIVFGVVQQAFLPTTYVFEDGQLNVNRQNWGALSVPLGIAVLVVGLVWVYRVASNARAVGDPTRPSPGWAVGSFLIPVAHIVLPIFPLREAWTKSRAGGPGLFWAWAIGWMLHLLGSYVGAVWAIAWGFSEGSKLGQGRVVLEAPASLETFGWVAAAVSAVAAALFLAVVWKFEAAQRGMAAYLARQHAGGQEPSQSDPATGPSVAVPPPAPPRHPSDRA